MINYIEVINTALDAGTAILNFYSKPIKVERKEDNSPLTQADLAAHDIIVNALKRISPDVPIISEESRVPDYNERKEWNRFWLVDPLDGTKEFLKKNGEFTVNIALIENNVPVFGVVYIPAKNVTYFGELGKGSFKIENGKQKKIISKTPDLDKPVTVVSSRSHGSNDLEEKLSELGVTIGNNIAAGSSLKFCLVAEGSADIYPRFGPTMEWDTGAGDAVFRYSGEEVRYSPIRYNKESLLNEGFIIGLNGSVDK